MINIQVVFITGDPVNEVVSPVFKRRTSNLALPGRQSQEFTMSALRSLPHVSSI